MITALKARCKRKVLIVKVIERSTKLGSSMKKAISNKFGLVLVWMCFQQEHKKCLPWQRSKYLWPGLVCVLRDCSPILFDPSNAWLMAKTPGFNRKRDPMIKSTEINFTNVQISGDKKSGKRCYYTTEKGWKKNRGKKWMDEKMDDRYRSKNVNIRC